MQIELVEVFGSEIGTSEKGVRNPGIAGFAKTDAVRGAISFYISHFKWIAGCPIVISK